MKFKSILLNEIIIYLNKTILYLAIEKENIDVIKILLANDKLDINNFNILT